MKAIRVHRLGEPDVMAIEEVPDLRPGRDQVLVSVKAAGVNPVDTYIRSGMYGRLPDLPYTPGLDGAGTVEAIGEAVKGIPLGDRVYVAGSVTGTYAQHVVCAAAQVHPLPERVSFEQGAALGVPYGIAYRALFHRASARPGETVLVHGASGGAGIAAVQLANAGGLVVIGTAGSPEGLELVRREGARHALNHGAAGHFDEIMGVTEGRGVDIILEMAAHVNLGRDLGVLAPGGRVVVIGSRGTVEMDPRDIMMRDAAILGVLLFNASTSELRTIHAGLGAGLENGTLRPVIDKAIPLSEAPRAHVEVMQSRALGKIVLVP